MLVRPGLEAGFRRRDLGYKEWDESELESPKTSSQSDKAKGYETPTLI